MRRYRPVLTTLTAGALGAAIALMLLTLQATPRKPRPIVEVQLSAATFRDWCLDFRDNEAFSAAFARQCGIPIAETAR